MVVCEHECIIIIINECRAAVAMAGERFVGAAPMLKERKAAPTAIQEGRVSV